MRKLSLLILCAFASSSAFSQISFIANGTWTVPAGVTSATIEVVGAGGNGGGNGGGGGGGGGYASGVFTVVPGTAYTITVGAAGSSTATSVGTLGISATAGGNGSFSGPGAGGVGTGGTINRTGGSGGAGTNTYFGGGGGGAAGPTANGGNGGATPAWTGSNCLQPGGAVGISGGAPGGAGGKGSGFTDNACNANNPATPGANYGGGGGGGNGNSGPASNGAGGYVSITWCASTAAPTGTASQSFCGSATVANLTATGTGIKWYAAATGGAPLASTTALVNGTHYFASQTISGCESPTRFDVTATVVALNLSVTQAGPMLTSAATGASYKWINCANNSAITGATAQTYTATANGSYAVIVTIGSCTDTSICYAVTGVGVSNSSTREAIRIFPNPASNKVTIEVKAGLLGTPYQITDAAGRVVRQGTLQAEITSVDVHELSKGMYLLKAGENNTQSFKVMKR